MKAIYSVMKTSKTEIEIGKLELMKNNETIKVTPNPSLLLSKDTRWFRKLYSNFKE